MSNATDAQATDPGQGSGPAPGAPEERGADAPLSLLEHDHVFLNAGRAAGCYLCGRTLEDLRAEHRDQLWLAAIERLTTVLERLEAKL